MSIIAITDFKGDQKVAGTSNQGTREDLQNCIDKYEPKFLRALYGSVMANAFIQGLAADPVEQRWTDLATNADLKQMLVCYVYYWYSRRNATLTAGTSEVKPENENSRPVSIAQKQTTSWNEMVDLVDENVVDLTAYPEYVPTPWRYASWRNGCFWWNRIKVSDIYFRISTLNL